MPVVGSQADQSDYSRAVRQDDYRAGLRKEGGTE